MSTANNLVICRCWADDKQMVRKLFANSASSILALSSYIHCVLALHYNKDDDDDDENNDYGNNDNMIIMTTQRGKNEGR